MLITFFYVLDRDDSGVHDECGGGIRSAEAVRRTSTMLSWRRSWPALSRLRLVPLPC